MQKNSYREREIQVKYRNKLTNVILVEITDSEGVYYDDISPFYFVNAMGNRCYIKAKDIKLAQLVCDAYTGVAGHYSVKSLKGQQANKRPLSARP